MSNHFTGLSLGPPLGDQRLDLCDLYAFQSPADPSRTVIILNANPTADALHPDAIYRLNIDNDGDCLTDIAFSYVFSKPQNGKQTVNVFVAKGAESRSAEAVGTKIIADAEVSFGAKPNIVKAGRLHVLRRQPQRRVLLRFRRHQESVRYQGRQKLHRASPGRQVAVDRRGFEYRSQRVLDGDRAADERARRQARDPHLGTMQRAPRRQARSMSIAPAIRASAASSTPTTPRRNTTPASRSTIASAGLDHVRPPDGAHRQLHPRRSDRRDRQGSHPARHADASIRRSPRSTPTAASSPTT